MKSQRDKDRTGYSFLQRISDSLGEYLGKPPRKNRSSRCEADFAAVSPPDAARTGYTPGLPDAMAAELLANLLLELPEQREKLSQLCMKREYQNLAIHTHKLLGAVVYCELPELAQSLRNLQKTLKSGQGQSIDSAGREALQAIDDTLMKSGYKSS